MHVGLMILTLVIGLTLLVKGADTFVDGAGRLAERMGVSPLVVGLTVVALGTSAPEAAISITSSFAAADGMTIANVLGSNIVNTLLILGVTALFAEVPLRRSTLRREMPLLAGSTALLLVLGSWRGVLGRVEAGVFLALLGAYLVHVIRSARGPRAEKAQRDAASGHDGSQGTGAEGVPGVGALIALSAVGAAVIAGGAHLTVESSMALARHFGMSDRLVGLTVVALGTSLPELITSLAAARRGETDMAVGNAVGSSVLNVLFVLGAAGVVRPIPFASELLLDGAVALLAIGALWLLGLRAGKLNRAGGMTLLGGYGAYLAHVLAG